MMTEKKALEFLQERFPDGRVRVWSEPAPICRDWYARIGEYQVQALSSKRAVRKLAGYVKWHDQEDIRTQRDARFIDL